MKLYRSEKSKNNILATYDLLLEQWNTKNEEIDIGTRYGNTHVIITGEKDDPPLLLFHGVGDDSALMWIYNAAFLSEHFRIYAVDTIGGPGKSVPGNRYNKDFDDTIWIDDVLDALKLDRLNIAGVSHGGYLAQLYTLMRPERVIRAASLAGSVAAGGGSPLKTMFRIFFPEAFFPVKKNVIKLIKKLSGDDFGALINNSVILDHFTFLLRGYNNMAMGYHKVSGFTDDQIDSIRDKVLYLTGDKDPFSILGGKDALIKYKMNARFFPGVGHGINHEIPDEINKILKEYFIDGGFIRNDDFESTGYRV